MTLREQFDVAVGKGELPKQPVNPELQRLVEKLRSSCELVRSKDRAGYRVELRRERTGEDPQEFVLVGVDNGMDEYVWELPIPRVLAQQVIGRRLGFQKYLYAAWVDTEPQSEEDWNPEASS